MEYFNGLDQLTAKQLQVAKKVSEAEPEAGYPTREDRYEGEARIREVARIMVEGCQVNKYTFGCLECEFFNSGRLICLDIEQTGSTEV
jgi:hypothetical protein